MSEIGKKIVDRIKSWKYDPSYFDTRFDSEDTYGYIYIHVTMSADISFTFYLIGDWT
jgi:hypothetical protein